jgi:23S rRNA (cytosine1962-C5)-methyltransferase
MNTLNSKPLQIVLKRNLRKSILQGHPWIYKEAIQNTPKTSGVGKIYDGKNEFLAWGLYDHLSPIAIRILKTTDKPPTLKDKVSYWAQALAFKSQILTQETNCLRLFNGEGDRTPGLICDIYNDIAVVQFDSAICETYWDLADLCAWLKKQNFNNKNLKSIIVKSRETKDFTFALGSEVDASTTILENGAVFLVNVLTGQKTGFFLDQRDNRFYVRNFAKGKTVLNAFSYTGGFSVNAGLGGAKHVTSLDISKGALEVAHQNWCHNKLQENRHQIQAADAFEFIKESREKWDFIIVDPPSMTRSEKTKELATQKYIEVFANAAKHLEPHGHLFLSSCSSHISFSDFLEICNQSLSIARKQGQILHVSGQGADHPFPHICPELRYLKFIHLVLNPF